MSSDRASLRPVTDPLHRAVLIGLGVAGGVAARATATLDSIDVLAGVDPLGSNARGAEGVIPVFLSLEELAGIGEVDLAIVSVPTPLHHQVCGELLEHNIAPVMWCEKPLASGFAQAEALTLSAADHGVELQVMLHTAFAPEVLWTSRELDRLAHRHGPPVSTSSVFRDAYLEQLERRTASLASSWLDSGINALSVLARFFTLGELIDASGKSPLWGRASARFDYNGAEGVASISTSWDTSESHKATTILFEDSWSLLLDHSEASATLLDASSREQERHSFGPTPLQTRYRSMFEAYLARSPLMFDEAQVAVMHRRLSEAQQTIEAEHDQA
jgi:predicted dehydrogenase